MLHLQQLFWENTATVLFLYYIKKEGRVDVEKLLSWFTFSFGKQGGFVFSLHQPSASLQK